MQWMRDTSAGDWLRERIDDPWQQSMHSVVPHGFAAYARVLHPPIVREDADHRAATWAETAAAFGTRVHPLAQWHRIVRTPEGDDWNVRIAPDGREFTGPMTGELDTEMLSLITGHLLAHTSTADIGFTAIWEGYGGLLGNLGHSLAGRSFFTIGGDANHQAMLDSLVKDPLNDSFRKPTWQEGILSREISEGPRLQLPGREYVLFEGSLRPLTSPDWVQEVPWRDLPGEAHGFPPSAQSPNLLWPADQAWVLVTEIDFDSTVIGGSVDLIASLCADDELEALPLPEGANLSWDADEING